ncbi:MAG TPA: polysaccharide deacetylase family protein [Candidatus Enterocloster faecavium]|uniref:Polysaccharide deacetylase family protein n=1 Tax=Candidatus Enterocloster faecavium TaxID=2838560 RepID=A0A9D2L828_9FIRM|nr:polysaccharide deacetylase family protein [Candidatus Enterocloster faecavium]
MRLKGKARKLAALLAALGVLCAGTGFTSYGGATGLGAVRFEDNGPGPGVGQTEAQSGTESETAAQPEEAQPSQTEGQAAGGAVGGAVGGASSTEEKPLQINYYGYFHGQAWSEAAADNHILQAPAGSWLTAVTANLVNIPSDAQIGVRYQVNLSGSGWLDWAADGGEAGGAGGEMPLEAVRMELTGSSAEHYDLYYRVYQNGSWTDWSANGAAAGQEGVGLRIDGIRAGIVAKGANPPEEFPGSRIDPSRPMIALTFDDGPKASVTNRILDSLQAYGGRATFFMVGSNVTSNAAVVQRMAAQGCEVANHTHDHQYISKIGAQGIISQVTATNQKIQAACGVSPSLLRPPGGYYDSASLAVLGNLGMPAVMWSIDTRDWQHRNAQRTIDTVLSQVKDGDIILMHDIYSTSADAAQVLIPELTARGFQLVTVSELAAFRGGMVPGKVYSQFRP